VSAVLESDAGLGYAVDVVPMAVDIVQSKSLEESRTRGSVVCSRPESQGAATWQYFSPFPRSPVDRAWLSGRVGLFRFELEIRP
jgi:hypothetical protein